MSSGEDQQAMMTKAESSSIVLWKNDWGWMGMLLADEKLTRLVLPRRTRREVLNQLGEYFSRDAVNLKGHSFTKKIDDYLKGKIETIPLPYDLVGTEFQRKVWRATRKIPYGQTRSYSWVAEHSGHPKAYQAVGQAMGANPLPLVVPCHRVTSKNDLGGFSGGRILKKRLLSLEKGGEDTR